MQCLPQALFPKVRRDVLYINEISSLSTHSDVLSRHAKGHLQKAATANKNANSSSTSASNSDPNSNPTPTPSLSSQNPPQRDDPQRLLPPTPRDVPLAQSAGLSSSLDFLADISAHQARTEPDINPMVIDDQQPYFGWNDVAALHPPDQHPRPVPFESVPNEMLQLWLEPRADTVSHHSSLDLMRDPALGLVGENFIPPERRNSQPIKSGDNIPNERFCRVERCWLAPPNHVGRLINSLWRDVSCCDCDNLFSIPNYHAPPLGPQSDNYLGSRFGLDDECRLQLQAAFGLAQSSLPSMNSPANDALSPAASTSASASIPTFPPAEILDMALDLYFRHYHPLVPFVHIPTFCAKRTRLPMLFVMCLIGMIILGTKGSTHFVLKTFGVSSFIVFDAIYNISDCTSWSSTRSVVSWPSAPSAAGPPPGSCRPLRRLFCC